MEIKGDRCAGIGRRRYTAHHARTGTKRDQRGPHLARPVHHRGDVWLVRRIGHHVGGGAEVVQHGPHRFVEALAIGVRGAVIAFGGANPRKRGRRGDARGTQADIRKRRCGDAGKVGDTEAPAMTVKCEGFFLCRHAFAFATPAEDLETCLRHVRFPPPSATSRSAIHALFARIASQTALDDRAAQRGERGRCHEAAGRREDVADANRADLSQLQKGQPQNPGIPRGYLPRFPSSRKSVRCCMAAAWPEG